MRIKIAGADGPPFDRRSRLEGEKNLLKNSFRIFSANLSPGPFKVAEAYGPGT
jgi:hypothetical protein